VTVCECKKSAGALTKGQAERAIALADRLGANTIFAALEGDFTDDVKEVAQPPRVRLVTGEQLVPLKRTRTAQRWRIVSARRRTWGPTSR